jgi:two-component system invasion response regulator UvrY
MFDVVIVDDHSVVRAGIRRLLEERGDVEIREAEAAEQAEKVVGAALPHLMILDLTLPGSGGFELLRHFVATVPGLPILIFSMHDDSVYASRALEAGARGYLSKGAQPQEILTAVEIVLQGGTYIEKAIAADLREKSLANDGFLRDLTYRELEILRLLSEGQTLTEIAGVLGVAYKTIANTCTRLREKLGARNTVELVTIHKGLGGA